MDEESSNADGQGEPEDMRADDEETEEEEDNDGDVSPGTSPANNISEEKEDNDENENENGAKGSAKASGGAKKSKAKSKAAAAAARGTSKPYIELVHEAIAELKDRTGSSQPAVMKYLLSKYPNLQNNNPNNRFKTHVLGALKSGVKSGRFVKVRSSWKINSEWKKKQAAAQKRKRQQEAKRKQEQRQKKKEEEEENNKDPLQKKIDTLRAKKPDSSELKKLLAEQKKKEEAEAKRKWIAERIRRRRFPMEDTKLHAEDRELGVKPPKDVIPRPNLPVFFSLTQSDGQKPSTKYNAANASRCENLDKGNRGLVSDLLQVYHFFRGDVHYKGTADQDYIPEFSLKHLIYAVDDVLNHTAKRSRMVPPLLVHLFVTCLQLLTEPPDPTNDETPERRQLQKDFANHLRPGLAPTSWGDICFLYMMALDGHFQSDASADKNGLRGLPIDADYLLGLHDDEAPMEVEEAADQQPEGYFGFLGPADGVLAKAVEKLGKSDPWMLTAEEIMAVLRVLTDEVLARRPEISEDISGREEKMYELLKAKRAADAKFRKVRLAFEGPKQPPKKPNDDKAQDDDDKRKSLESSGSTEENGKEAETKWKPTATKKQFESAKKAQQKASDAYEKGIRNLMARTEPVGRDRHYNAVYCFRHDPEVLYVEMVKTAPTSGSQTPNWQHQKFSWHVIDKKSMFDDYEKSLDKRGKREKALHEELTGPPGTHQSLRRFLFDDIKEKAAANAQKKEKEDLLRRMENAKHKCEDDGRRSGRLASRGEEEKKQIQEEIDLLNQKIKSGAEIKELDYVELTGLELLRKFDSGGKVETRRSRSKKKKAATNSNGTVQSMLCSKLCSTGNIDATGLVGILVSKLLEVEEMCESLVPWNRKNMERKTWISDLEGLVVAWNVATPVLIGPQDDSAQQAASPRPSMDMSTSPSTLSATSKGKKKRPSTGGSSASKRTKMESESTQPSSLTIAQAVSRLKTPLLDIEKRVYEIAGLAMAANDLAVADDNMSAKDEEGGETEKERKEKLAWKKLINKIRYIPSKRHAAIRDVLVDAIAAARKAHLKEVVSHLKEALLEFHPTAAGACKTAALKVLEDHGGYDDSEDDDEEEADEADKEKENKDEKGDEVAENYTSALSADGVLVNGSLSDTDEFNHADWVDAVKLCRTLSRIASLVTAFAAKAKTKLGKLSAEHDSLMEAVALWEKEEERRLKRLANNGKVTNNPFLKEVDSLSEVWANVTFTDEIVMASVEDYPWWPAKMCTAKDEKLDASLKSLKRCLVSLMGEQGALRVVQADRIRPFTGELLESGDEMGRVKKEDKVQLEECMSIARRLQRSLKGKAKPVPSIIFAKPDAAVKAEPAVSGAKAEEKAEPAVGGESKEEIPDAKGESADDAKVEPNTSSSTS